MYHYEGGGAGRGVIPFPDPLSPAAFGVVLG